MAGFNFQFHALPEENLEIIRDCATDLSAFITIEQSFPRLKRREIAPSALLDETMDFGVIHWVYLTLAEPRIVGLGVNDFVPNNSDLLYLHLGTIENGVLTESQMATSTAKLRVREKWNKVLARYKAETKKGGWLRDPNDAGSWDYRSAFRFTSKVYHAEAHGLRFSDIGRRAIIRFHEPNAKGSN